MHRGAGAWQVQRGRLEMLCCLLRRVDARHGRLAHLFQAVRAVASMAGCAVSLQSRGWACAACLHF